jgi:hypothetical protein
MEAQGRLGTIDVSVSAAGVEMRVAALDDQQEWR